MSRREPAEMTARSQKLMGDRDGSSSLLFGFSRCASGAQPGCEIPSSAPAVIAASRSATSAGSSSSSSSSSDPSPAATRRARSEAAATPSQFGGHASQRHILVGTSCLRRRGQLVLPHGVAPERDGAGRKEEGGGGGGGGEDVVRHRGQHGVVQARQGGRRSEQVVAVRATAGA